MTSTSSSLRCSSWRQEGLLRLLENVVAIGENPKKLVVYATFGKAARSLKAFDKIVHLLQNMNEGQTLVIQSGKPIGVFSLHPRAPIVLIANCNVVGCKATAEHFYELEEKGLLCWGGLTAGSWQYIGLQGVVQGAYELFSSIAQEHFNNSLRGRWILTSGLGGMGSAQPVAARIAEAVMLVVEVDEAKVQDRKKKGYLDVVAATLEEAITLCEYAKKERSPLSVGLIGNAAAVYQDLADRSIVPDIVTDMTNAHDLRHGYVPIGYTPESAKILATKEAKRREKEALQSIALHCEALLQFRKKGAIVVENGNNLRVHGAQGGVPDALTIDIFSARYIRPLFCQGIGPFRWISLVNNKEDIFTIDALVSELFFDVPRISSWIEKAPPHIPFQGLPARTCWLGHKERTLLAIKVNEAITRGKISGPVAFTRDHFDAGSMTHPFIGTEGMKDGSDAIADWPLLNALLNCASGADLVSLHSGGGGYSGYMTSSGMTVIADGTAESFARLTSLTHDTGIGVLRYADAGYEQAAHSAHHHQLGFFINPGDNL